jgi:hypothetical protein
MGDIGGTNQHMVVGPTAAGEFGHAEIFELAIPVTESAHALGDFAAGLIERVAGVFVELRVYGQSEETIGASSFGFDGEFADFLLGTMAAGPLAAGQSNPNRATQLGGVSFQSLGVRTGLEKPPEGPNGCDGMGRGFFVPGGDEVFRERLRIWHRAPSLQIGLKRGFPPC